MIRGAREGSKPYSIVSSPRLGGWRGASPLQIATRVARRAVCDTRNVDLVGSIGADRVIDYTSVDFTNGGEQYDVIYDAVGKLRFGRARLSLTSSGVDLATDLWQNMALALLTPLLCRRKVKFRSPPINKTTSCSSHNSSRPGTISRSSTGAIHWSASSKRPGTWQPVRKPVLTVT